MHHQITKTILRHYKISVAELKRKCRKRELVEARQVVCYFLREYTRLSLEKIGEIIDRNHATVLHGQKSIKDLTETDKDFREQIFKLKREIERVTESPYITITKKEYNELKNKDSKPVSFINLYSNRFHTIYSPIFSKRKRQISVKEKGAFSPFLSGSLAMVTLNHTTKIDKKDNQ